MSNTAVTQKPAGKKLRGKAPMTTQNRWLLAILLGPAIFFLTVFVVYPIGYSIVRSTYSRNGEDFVFTPFGHLAPGNPFEAYLPPGEGEGFVSPE